MIIDNWNLIVSKNELVGFEKKISLNMNYFDITADFNIFLFNQINFLNKGTDANMNIYKLANVL